jgi:PAS domain S-box-containing protein
MNFLWALTHSRFTARYSSRTGGTHDTLPSAGNPLGSRRPLQPRERAMKARQARLFGGFPDAMVIVDPQGTILRANAQAVSLFGSGERQLNGMPIQALFPDYQMHCSGGWSRRRGQGDRYLELTGSRGDSRRFRAAVTVMPIETDSGTGAVMSIRDLTAARETQFILERGLEMLSAVISSG